MNKTNVDGYTIYGNIGKGTFGEVYKAKCHDTKEMVAVKIINLQRCAGKDRDHMFTEISILKKIQHEHLVQYKTSFDQGRYLYIVMELCTEGNLRTFIAQKNGLNEGLFVYILRQVVLGIQYLHQKDIVHRDVKTTNIFLTKSGEDIITKIGDFGLARFDISINPTLLVGSPYFMSPEMIDGKPYGKPTDIWSLGCCAYEMATTNIPFEASVIDSLKKKIINGEVAHKEIQYCNEVKQLVQQMLSQDANNRPDVECILERLNNHSHDMASDCEVNTLRKSRKHKKSKPWSPQSRARTSGQSGQDISSGYDSPSRVQAEKRVQVTVPVLMTKKESDYYEKVQMFEKDIRSQLQGNEDQTMKKINSAIDRTKQMENSTIFMSEVEKILDKPIFNECKLYLESLWMYKRPLLTNSFKLAI